MAYGGLAEEKSPPDSALDAQGPNDDGYYIWTHLLGTVPRTKRSGAQAQAAQEFKYARFRDSETFDCREIYPRCYRDIW